MAAAKAPSPEAKSIEAGHAVLIQQLYTTYANAQLTAATEQDRVHADTAFSNGVERAMTAKQRALNLL